MNKSNFLKLIIIFALIPFLLGFSFCFAQERDSQEETDQPKRLRILYQGQLTDSEGNPIEDGRYNMRFEIYDDDTQGEVLWKGEYAFYNAISVEEGQFKVILGRENPIELDLNQAPFWLVITIGSFGDEGKIQWREELQPRKKITTLSELLGEEELTQADWENISQVIEEKLGDQTDIVLLFDINQLENLEKEASSGSSSKIYSAFQNLLNFISDKISEIGEKLNLILDKLKNIISTLAEIKYKIDALYNALIVNKGLAPEGEVDFGGENEQVSGTGIIKAGQKTAEIEDNSIQENSLIFVAFADSPDGLWQISKNSSEKYFELTLEEPAPEDLRFEYWIVNKERKQFDQEQEPSCDAEHCWSCTGWEPANSTVSCGEEFTQTRTCTDSNGCGIEEGKPIEEQQVVGTNEESCGTTLCNPDGTLHLAGQCQNSCVEGSCQSCTPTCNCADGFSDCNGDSTGTDADGCETQGICSATPTASTSTTQSE